MAGFNSVEFNSSLGNHLNNQFPTAQVTDTNNEKKEYKPKDVAAKEAADFLKKYAKTKKGKK